MGITKEEIEKKAKKYAYTKEEYGLWGVICAYIAGYEQALKDSLATEMLEMLSKTLVHLKEIQLQSKSNHLNQRILKIENLIKKVTE